MRIRVKRRRHVSSRNVTKSDETSRNVTKRHRNVTKRDETSLKTSGLRGGAHGGRKRLMYSRLTRSHSQSIFTLLVFLNNLHYWCF